MRTPIVVAFLTVISYQSLAQPNDEKIFYLKKIEKYRKMKTTGALLTVGGSILAVAGIVTLLNTTYTTTYNSNGYAQTTTTGNPAGGAITYLVGAAGIGAGIPLWIVGGHSHRKYMRKLEAMPIGFHLKAQPAGLALAYRF